MPSLRHLVAVSGVAVLALAAGCSSDNSSSSGAATSGAAASTGASSAASGDASSYPMTVDTPEGKVTIKEKPKNIVSTSVVLTGSLLAIDAPVKGSGAGQPNEVGFDDQGFFTHWSKVAKEKGVKPLYTKSTLDLEAVTAAQPDLIIMGESGGDSTKDQYAQLSQIAPVVSIDYLKMSWQDVEKELGRITGNTEQTTKLLADYDQQIAGLKAKTAAPKEAVQSAVFQGDQGAAIVLPGSAQNDVFKELGFTLAPTDTAKAEKASGGGSRTDVAFFSVENAVALLTAKTLLLVDGDDKTVAAYKSAAGFKTTPAAQAGGKIVPLGHSSFKMDYYSALEMAKTLQAAFPKS